MVGRIALLDSKFLEYEHAVIGIVESTMNVGTVFVTLFPNFNMSIKDPYLTTALKVQVQIVGVSQVQGAFARTLHYQMVYRVQNHALELNIPSNDGALHLMVDGHEDALSYQFVPK